MQEQSTICKTREELIRAGGRLGPSPFPADLQARWPLWMLFVLYMVEPVRVGELVGGSGGGGGDVPVSPGTPI